MAATLLSRLFGPRLKADHLTFTVYTRQQCCCCHKAIDILEESRKRYQFQLETIDIDADPELVSKYNTEVPVVAVDGKVRFRGVVNPALLDRLLAAECKNR